MRNMGLASVVLTSVLASLLTAGTAFAESTTIDIASPASEASAQGKLLKKLSSDLAVHTERRLDLHVLPGGAAGDDRDVVRKMNLGQVQAGYVGVLGLSLIVEAIQVLELPRLFASNQELDYVADKMWPYFQKQFEAKGFRLQDRTEIGWRHVLSKKEIKAFADLNVEKPWLNGDELVPRSLYKQLGVPNFVTLGVGDVESALVTGRVQVVYGSPAAVAARKWDAQVQWMTSQPISFGIAAQVVTLAAVKRMSKEDERIFSKDSSAAAAAMRASQRGESELAKRTFERNGMHVAPLPAAALAELDKAAQAVTTELTGKVFSSAELAMVLKYRAEFRASAAK
jgi:TRAP-type transport system periplasmic protein